MPKNSSSKRNNKNGSLQNRNGRYYLQYTINGIRKTTVLTDVDDNGLLVPVTTHERAEECASKILCKLRNSQDDAVALSSGFIALDNVWDDFLRSPRRGTNEKNTLRVYRTHWQQFEKYLKTNCKVKFLSDVSQIAAENFFADEWNRGIAARTYNARLQAVKLIWSTLLCQHEHIKSPFRLIKNKTNDTVRRTPLKKSEIDKIFELLDDPKYYMLHKDEMRVVIYMMCYLGCRGEDAIHSRWDAIRSDDEIMCIAIRDIKTKRKGAEPRLMPLHEVLQTEIFRLPKKSVYILPNVKARYARNPDGIYKDIKKLFEQSGIKTSSEATDGVRRATYIDKNGVERVRRVCNKSMHSIRHSFATVTASTKNVPMAVVSDMLGHTDEKMSKHYFHAGLQDKLDIIKQLPKWGKRGACNNAADDLISIYRRLSVEKQEELYNFAEWLLADCT